MNSLREEYGQAEQDSADQNANGFADQIYCKVYLQSEWSVLIQDKHESVYVHPTASRPSVMSVSSKAVWHIAPGAPDRKTRNLPCHSACGPAPASLHCAPRQLYLS